MILFVTGGISVWSWLSVIGLWLSEKPEKCRFRSHTQHKTRTYEAGVWVCIFNKGQIHTSFWPCLSLIVTYCLHHHSHSVPCNGVGSGKTVSSKEAVLSAPPSWPLLVLWIFRSSHGKVRLGDWNTAPSRPEVGHPDSPEFSWPRANLTFPRWTSPGEGWLVHI